MTLVIDTASFNKTELVLKDRNGRIINRLEFEAGKKLSEKLLPQIAGLFSKGARPGQAATGEIGLKDLIGIKVNLGPGSFTSLRIGVAVANALGYALNIPVNGQKMAVPEYGKEPNITLERNPKSRAQNANKI